MPAAHKHIRAKKRSRSVILGRKRFVILGLLGQCCRDEVLMIMRSCDLLDVAISFLVACLGMCVPF